MERKTIEKVKIAKGRLSTNHPELFEAVKKLLEPSYKNISSLIQREDLHCNRTFYLDDNYGNLITFFMVAEEDLFGKPSFYLGLNAVDHKYKNTGMNTFVILKALQHGLEFEKLIERKLIVYATTATPSIYNITEKLNQSLSPNRNGEYTEVARNIAKEFCKKHRIKESDHPFVLKGIAANTRYSDLENKRIEKIIKKKGFDLFRKLEIKEHEGDRLLMVMELPSTNKLNQILKLIQIKKTV